MKQKKNKIWVPKFAPNNLENKLELNKKNKGNSLNEEETRVRGLKIQKLYGWQVKT